MNRANSQNSHLENAVNVRLLLGMGGHQGRPQGKQAGPLPFKVLVIGKGGSGKSTIIRRYVTNQFTETTPTQVGNSHTELTPHMVSLSSAEGLVSKEVGVVFWEVSASPNNLIKREQYQHTDAVMVVASMLDDNYQATISLLQQEIQDMAGEEVPILVLVNSFRDVPEAIKDCHGDTVDEGESSTWVKVFPHTARSGIHEAVDQLLLNLKQKSYSKPYPTA